MPLSRDGSWAGCIPSQGMEVLLRCLVSDIGGKSGVWIHQWEKSFGGLVGGGMNCSGETEVGRLDLKSLRFSLAGILDFGVCGMD
jgi:hypothetical protein